MWLHSSAGKARTEAKCLDKNTINGRSLLDFDYSDPTLSNKFPKYKIICYD